MGRRYRLKSRPGYYVERDRYGRFKKWTKIPRSIKVDKRKKAKKVKPGYGHKGDLYHN